MNIFRALATVALLCAATFGSVVELHAQLGPILRVVPPTFDTTLCGTVECSNVTFENVGDAPLRVFSTGALTAPFSGNITTPFTLQPGQRTSFQVCYTPTVAPRRDTQEVMVRANGRLSLSIALLFDTSGSMSSTIGGIGGDTSTVTTARIVAANAAGRRFVATLVDTLGIRDTVAVCRFSTGYAVTQGFTTDTAALRRAIPSGTGGGTCLYKAIIQTNALLRTQNAPGRRVMIVLADGADNGCDGVTLANVIQNSNAPDPIRIFTVAIGAADATELRQIATATGGEFFTANNEQGLMAVYDSIAVLLSRNNLEQPFRMNGRAVTPIMDVNPTSIDFDSVRIGNSSCRMVTIANNGDAPLDVTSMTGFTGDFTISNPNIPLIQPGTSTQVEVCFDPSRLRVRTAAGAFGYTSCAPRTMNVSLRGVGYDSLVVNLRDTIVGRPGSIIEIPVYLREPIPAFYDVNNYELSVSYNKTMLYPADTFAVTGGTISSPLVAGTDATIYDSQRATTTVTLSGGTLQSADSNGTLIRLRFMVLHGNAMQTPVTIASARFADGNPKLGLAGPGLFATDSLCYQEQRLIDASARYMGLLKMVASDAGGAGATARYSITEPATIRLRLYDGLGRQVRSVADGYRNAGDYESRFSTADLPRGIYYLRLEAGPAQDVKLLMIGN